MESKTKHTYLHFALRVIVATALLAGVIVGIYWIAYRAYPTVAEWRYPDSHEVLVVEGERYRRAGVLGQNKLNAADYTIDSTVGRVKGGEAITRSASDLSSEHTYVLYRVKKQTDMLLLLEPDGSHTLYCLEVAEWASTDDQNSFVYKGKTYEQIGPASAYGSDFNGYLKLGFVSRDSETAHGAAMLYNVKVYPYLLVVDGEDGHQYLYCRKGEERPLTLAEKN